MIRLKSEAICWATAENRVTAAEEKNFIPSPALSSEMKMQGVVLREGKSDFPLLRDRVALVRRISRSRCRCYQW